MDLPILKYFREVGGVFLFAMDSDGPVQRVHSRFNKAI